MPQHPRAIELSEQLKEAVARRAAAEAAERLRREIEELIRSASQRLHSTDDNASDLPAALREVNQVLALDAAHTEAQTLKTSIEEAITARREAAGSGPPSATPAAASRMASIRPRSSCSKTISRRHIPRSPPRSASCVRRFSRSRNNAEPNESASSGNSAWPRC